MTAAGRGRIPPVRVSRKMRQSRQTLSAVQLFPRRSSPTPRRAEPLPQVESAEHHPALESPAQESPGSPNGQAPSQNSAASELVTAALPPDPVIASLQSELSRFRQDLLDLQVQTKTQQKLQQVQILSLEEDNALLKDQVLGLRNQLRQLGYHNHSGPRGKQQPIQSHQLQRRDPSTAPQSILKSFPGKSRARKQAESRVPHPVMCTLPLRPMQSSYRIIWGTRKSCSVDEVKSVLSGLLAGAEIPPVRRSFKRLGSGMAWWFTVTCEERTISVLESKWGTPNLIPGWALLKSLKDRPTHSSSKAKSVPSFDQVHPPAASTAINPPLEASSFPPTPHSTLPHPLPPTPPLPPSPSGSFGELLGPPLLRVSRRS